MRAGTGATLTKSLDSGMMDARGSSKTMRPPSNLASGLGRDGSSAMDGQQKTSAAGDPPRHGGGTGGRLTQMHLHSPRSPSGARDSYASRPPLPVTTPTRTATASASPIVRDPFLSASVSGSHGTSEAHQGDKNPSRPPPAGMRGAFSWGVGPNAYEVDGRPGTRGGGPAVELDGRPSTRSGGMR